MNLCRVESCASAASATSFFGFDNCSERARLAKLHYAKSDWTSRHIRRDLSSLPAIPTSNTLVTETRERSNKSDSTLLTHALIRRGVAAHQIVGSRLETIDAGL